MNIKELLQKQRIYFDGGMGTLLQAAGLAPGEQPETWNLKHPEKIVELHKKYLAAGSNIISTNTFGLNRYKFTETEKYAAAAVKCAQEAAADFPGSYVAYDIGPLGKLLKPMGDLPFSEAVAAFAESAAYAKKFGADLIIIETMNDSYETKAAVLAAKETTDLPIFVTNVFDAKGKLMTGADARAMIAMLEGLRVDAIGMNCSLGPEQMIPVVREYTAYSSLPVIVNPNAGLPCVKDGQTCYDVDAEQFAVFMKQIAEMGAAVLGGCCGTTPEYIKKTVEETKNLPFAYPSFKEQTLVSSYTHAVQFCEKPVLIGERINPTGKKKIKEALRNQDYNYILTEGIKQADAGVQMLDVNAGLPEIDETAAMTEIVCQLQAVTDLPLQLDTTNAAALEQAMRIYNGKPLINSVNGNRESMDAVFPLVQKYGGAVIALTMDESGIPDTAEKRLGIAEKIVEEAKKYGIDKKDIIVDPLALTVSSDQNSALVTLKAIRLIKEKLGVPTSLGVSNISFGLPSRDAVNSTFFAMALQQGLDAAIMNPFSENMMKVYYAFNLLSALDKNCEEYIAFATDSLSEAAAAKPAENTITLEQAIIKGLHSQAEEIAGVLIKNLPPMEIINGQIIPALNQIGTDFEQGKAYLPQLLMSADAASSAFEIIKAALPPSSDRSKEIVLATVHGDIHDIGKNIVRVLLENFGFSVLDLGRDVPPQKVLEAAEGHKLVGLSALMTTTVPAMEETIQLIHEKYPEIKIVVGGAVLNPEYARMIQADFYAADAMETVRIAQKLFE
ncbi:MAG: homocysteine S-methyltransferase family protein [Bacillota bacterium]|jgi:5-methyltetrahydrofolate--homocysteine methyltransferase